LRRIRIDADANDDHFLSVIEERGVLITVRLHLNRSAFGPGFREERQYHRLAPKLGELDRLLEQSVARRAGEREIGRHVADRRRKRR
jgi:hypothetical protein